MNRRFAILFLFIFVFAEVAILAQNKASLQVQCNQSGAQVFIAGRLAGTTTPNLAVLVVPGAYAIKVAKQGFQDFDVTVTVTSSGFVLPVTLVAKGAAPAPAPAPAPSAFALQVVAPSPNAEVFINGQSRGKAPVTVQVPAGQYTVTVRAPGFLEFNQTVTVNGPTTVNAGAMQPQTYQIGISANVGGAQVFLNGNLAGTIPFSASLAPGSYSLTLRAPNYVDYSQNIVVNGPLQVSATLQPMTFVLGVQANVVGAQVFLNGNLAGNAPYNAQLMPGNYSLIIRAPGFSDYTEAFSLSGPKTVAAVLQPLMASFQVGVPAALANKDLKGGHWAQLQIFIDGALLKAPGASPATGSTVPPGRHTIRITSGAFETQVVIDFVAGKAYVIEPMLSLTVK